MITRIVRYARCILISRQVLLGHMVRQLSGPMEPLGMVSEIRTLDMLN